MNTIMIGAPVAKVRTPPLLRAYLAQRGVAADIPAREVTADELGTFMQEVQRDRSITGLLVTTPHKQAIVAHLADVSAIARAAGSVNAVKRVADGGLVGVQFDGIALVNALLAKGVPVGESRILVVGLGGAGLAIAQALAMQRCPRLDVYDVDPARLGAALRGVEGIHACDLAAPALDGARYDILVNATPLGMVDGDGSPIPELLVRRAGWVADIVADPSRTRLAAMASDAGAVLISGRDMVEGQVAAIGDWLLTDQVEQ